jgi:hypothetical protein
MRELWRSGGFAVRRRHGLCSVNCGVLVSEGRDAAE